MDQRCVSVPVGVAGGGGFVVGMPTVASSEQPRPAAPRQPTAMVRNNQFVGDKRMESSSCAWLPWAIFALNFTRGCGLSRCRRISVIHVGSSRCWGCRLQTSSIFSQWHGYVQKNHPSVVRRVVPLPVDQIGVSSLIQSSRITFHHSDGHVVDRRNRVSSHCRLHTQGRATSGHDEQQKARSRAALPASILWRSQQAEIASRFIVASITHRSPLVCLGQQFECHRAAHVHNRLTQGCLATRKTPACPLDPSPFRFSV